MLVNLSANEKIDVELIETWETKTIASQPNRDWHLDFLIAWLDQKINLFVSYKGYQFLMKSSSVN